MAGALTTGHEAWLKQDDVEAMRNAGIYHILSISGAHMAIAGFKGDVEPAARQTREFTARVFPTETAARCFHIREVGRQCSKLFPDTRVIHILSLSYLMRKSNWP